MDIRQHVSVRTACVFRIKKKFKHRSQKRTFEILAYIPFTYHTYLLQTFCIPFTNYVYLLLPFAYLLLIMYTFYIPYIPFAYLLLNILYIPLNIFFLSFRMWCSGNFSQASGQRKGLQFELVDRIQLRTGLPKRTCSFPGNWSGQTPVCQGMFARLSAFQ
jgi:hypothetical protein